MCNGWTPERRARQAEQIRQWQPWTKSTGPRSAEGKAAAARNALKHGGRSAEWLASRKRMHDLLRRCRDAIKRVR